MPSLHPPSRNGQAPRSGGPSGLIAPKSGRPEANATAHSANSRLLLKARRQFLLD